MLVSIVRMAEPRSELGQRKAAVLRAVVESYVRSGEPVGSEAVAEHAGLGVSSATIRNEMAALEELGYLSHPHTSAGRIPTDAGYRHYVDGLPAVGKLREAQRKEIASHFAEAIVDLEEVLKGSVQLLSRLTQYAGLAVPPWRLGGADRAARADRHGPDADGARRRPARPGGQADRRPARAPGHRSRSPTPSAGSRRSAARPTWMPR